MPIWGGVEEKYEPGDVSTPSDQVLGKTLFIGPADGAAVDTIYFFDQTGDPRSELGEGPLTDYIEDFLDSGGEFAYAIASAVDTVGVKRTIVHVGSGLAVVAHGAGSDPLSRYEMVIQIIAGGALGAATYRWSLDGGTNWSGEISTPVSAATEVDLGSTGLTVTFDDAAGVFVAEETYSFVTEAPKSGLSSILASLDYAVERVSFEGAAVACDTDDTIWAGLSAAFSNLFDDHKPAFVIVQSRLTDESESTSDWIAALNTLQDGFSSDYVLACAGGAPMISSFTGRRISRGILGVIAGQCSKNPVHRSIGTTIYNQATIAAGFYPEDITQAQLKFLDSVRYTVLRSHEGLNGRYINNGNMMAETISDFQYIEDRRTANKAIRLCRVAALAFVDLEADDPGLAALETALEKPLSEQMLAVRNISSYNVTVPLGQEDEISAQITFKRTPTARLIKLFFSLGI